jgi:hypothetical protein
MAEFNIGARVRITDAFKDVGPLQPGDVGIITDFREWSELPFVVEFEDGNDEYFAAVELELAGEPRVEVREPGRALVSVFDERVITVVVGNDELRLSTNEAADLHNALGRVL